MISKLNTAAQSSTQLPGAMRMNNPESKPEAESSTATEKIEVVFKKGKHRLKPKYANSEDRHQDAIIH